MAFATIRTDAPMQGLSWIQTAKRQIKVNGSSRFLPFVTLWKRRGLENAALRPGKMNVGDVK
jgi:hypothetical protein